MFYFYIKTYGTKSEKRRRKVHIILKTVIMFLDSMCIFNQINYDKYFFLWCYD